MEEQGLTIRFDENLYKKEKVIQIDGVFSMFITCGNQYGILYRLARNIGFTLTDLDNGKSYKSSNPEMTFSHSGNHIYNKYSKMPCDQIVSEGFSIKLDDVYFKNPPETSISNFELSANYYHESNVLTFKNTPITLKNW